MSARNCNFFVFLLGLSSARAKLNKIVRKNKNVCRNKILQFMLFFENQVLIDNFILD